MGSIGDSITSVGDLHDAEAQTTIRAEGLAVAPGFVNMMSGDDSLRVDGRSMSDIKQGVTTEIFGEGDSMGPLTGGAIAASFGLRWGFLITAGLLLANLIWVYFTVPEYVDVRDE